MRIKYLFLLILSLFVSSITAQIDLSATDSLSTKINTSDTTFNDFDENQQSNVDSIFINQKKDVNINETPKSIILFDSLANPVIKDSTKTITIDSSQVFDNLVNNLTQKRYHIDSTLFISDSLLLSTDSTLLKKLKSNRSDTPTLIQGSTIIFEKKEIDTIIVSPNKISEIPSTVNDTSKTLVVKDSMLSVVEIDSNQTLTIQKSQTSATEVTNKPLSFKDTIPLKLSKVILDSHSIDSAITINPNLDSLNISKPIKVNDSLVKVMSINNSIVSDSASNHENSTKLSLSILEKQVADSSHLDSVSLNYLQDSLSNSKSVIIEENVSNQITKDTIDDLNFDLDKLLGIKKKVIRNKIIFHLKVIDNRSKKPISAQVKLVSIRSDGKNNDAEGKCNDQGKFKTYLTDHSHFEITLYSLGYKPFHKVLDLSKEHIEDVFHFTSEMEKFEVGDKITLDAVYFNQNQYQLLNGSIAQLDELIELMKKNPKLSIQLNGHTDINGNPKSNLELSENRVKSVRFHLIQGGIKLNKIRVKGFGGTQPITQKRDAQNRVKNRRVEFEILKI